jgi:hypothetical protein
MQLHHLINIWCCRVAATPQQEAAPLAAAVNVQQVDSSRRQLLLAASAALAAGAALPAVAEEEFAAPATPDTTITDKVCDFTPVLSCTHMLRTVRATQSANSALSYCSC